MYGHLESLSGKLDLLVGKNGQLTLELNSMIMTFVFIGEIPYSVIGNDDLLDYIKSGNRLGRPDQYISEEVYVYFYYFILN